MAPLTIGRSQLAALRRTTGDPAPVVAVAEMCPGACWSVTTVQTLVLTATHLHVVATGLPGTRRRLVRSLALGEVHVVRWATRTRWRRESIRLQVVTASGGLEHTGRADGRATTFALELDRLVHHL